MSDDGRRTAEMEDVEEGGCSSKFEDADDVYAESYTEDESDSQGDDFPVCAGHVVSSVDKKVEVIKLVELEERYRDEMSRVCDTLGLSPDMAMQALKHFKWDIVALNERWFDNCDKVKAEIGLDHGHAGQRLDPLKKVFCPVCLEYHIGKDMRSPGCQHWICVTCLQGYLAANLDDKHKVARLPCPEYGCKTLLPRQLLESVATVAQRTKLRSHDSALMVESNPRVGWCTRAGCVYVSVVPEVPRSDEPIDVKCTCGEAYCFTCKHEAHRPVDCATVKKWGLKNSAESENLTWIIANTKPCPRCQRPIEKDKGCMHMTCSQCKHEFCWLCQGDWARHGDSTGGYYACNKYEQGKQRGEYSEQEMQRKHARESLERYTHYYERYHAHDIARKAAAMQLAELTEAHLEKISEVTLVPRSQLQFITDAHRQVVECRRILKWTYAYGYYKFDDLALHPDEDTSAGRKRELEAARSELCARKAFFEFLQNDAESSLEPLTRLLEKRLVAFFCSDDFWRECSVSPDSMPDPKAYVHKQFTIVQQDLINRTMLARNFFEKLTNQLEQGLDKWDQGH